MNPLQRPASVLDWINSLWFASLICALSASFAMLARQWIQEYNRWMFAHPDDLHLFFAGLVTFSFQAHRIVGIVSALLIALTITLALPLFFAQCPFQTPPVRPLQNLFLAIYRWILQGTVYLSSIVPALKNHIQHQLTQHTLLTTSGRKEAHIINSKDTLDAQVPAMLISTSWDKTDKLIATALTSLPTSTQDVRDILRTTDAARLIDKRYLGLLRLGNEFPHLSIVTGRHADAYTYLRALLHL